MTNIVNRTEQSRTHIVILAAGKGTRMKSDLPKVLHKIGHYPMVHHVINAGKAVSPHVTVVISPQMHPYFKDFTFAPDLVVQDEQLGTGHAVKCALDHHTVMAQDKVIVLFGDTPLIQPETIQRVVDVLEDDSASLAPGIVVVGMTPKDPKSYGRLVCTTDEHVEKIVEFKHASSSEKRITLCNSGVMGFRFACLQKLLPRIKAQPENGEYYLTDIVALAREDAMPVHKIEAQADEVEGVNTRLDLAQAEFLFQQRMRNYWLEQGVTLMDAASTFFALDTELQQDVIIEPHVFFGPGVTIKSGALIKGFSHLERTVIEAGACVGPFARLRPGTHIGLNAKVGNFVEIKNATIQQDAKVNHLSYIGDADIGTSVNIGAGTITCNYDGVEKHKTVIKEGAFIGSNTSLVAPVTVGYGAIVGAGSTIVKDVADYALAIARGSQEEFPHKATQIQESKRIRKEKKKVA